MPVYKVHVCRIAYSHLDIEVEARNKDEASHKAEQEAGNHLFPNENTSEYEAQGCTKIESQLEAVMKRPGSIAEAMEDGFTQSFR